MRHIQSFLIFTFLLIGPVAAQVPPPSPETEPKVEQWLEWEQTKNVSYMVRNDPRVNVPYVEVSAEDFNVLEAIPGKTNPRILKIFKHKEPSLHRLPVHPYNEEPKVVGMEEKVKAKEAMKLKYYAKFLTTASRSLVYWKGPRPSNPVPLLISLKMGTDHIMGANAPHFNIGIHKQPKIKMKEEITDGLQRTRALTQLDEMWFPPRDLIILKDVAALSSKKTGEGVLVRDLSPLADGHYYLPAFSVPFIGKELAEKWGEDYGKYWAQHFARLLGRTKALLLIHYGIQMETPNLQNFLIQLDEHHRPTGKMVVRDLSDSDPFRNVMDASPAHCQSHLGVSHTSALPKPFPFVENIFFNWGNCSKWRLDECGVGDKILEDWELAHHEGYLETLNQELGTNIRPLENCHNVDFDWFFYQRRFGDNECRFLIPIQSFLGSAEGRKILSDYYAKNLNPSSRI